MLTIEEKQKLKAFEIIKEKMVDVGYMWECIGTKKYPLDAYNKDKTTRLKITKDQFDLLKEVLK